MKSYKHFKQFWPKWLEIEIITVEIHTDAQEAPNAAMAKERKLIPILPSTTSVGDKAIEALLRDISLKNTKDRETLMDPVIKSIHIDTIERVSFSHIASYT